MDQFGHGKTDSSFKFFNLAFKMKMRNITNKTTNEKTKPRRV